MNHYTRWRLRVPGELEELLTAELWACGSLGMESRTAMTDRVYLEAYFTDPLPAAARDFDAGVWRRRGVELVAHEPLVEGDWLASYRRGIEPVDVGERFRIDQRLERRPATLPSPVPEAGGRWTLKIPAQTAFGTGSHESTRLVVRWLEELDLHGLEVLDVGTGSGILSFAAELLGARRVVGFDRDSQAVCIARKNAGINAMTPRFFSGRLAALRPEPRFDLALVNILPEHVLDELSLLVPLLRPDARVISSGHLVRWRRRVLAELAARGFSCTAEKQENDWVAFLLAAPPAPVSGGR
ncbi:MAG: 50S ribosomal protein L11 methyltransferase [Thermoanaerobaculia bacterium]